MRLFKRLTTFVMFLAILIGSFFSFGLKIMGANTPITEPTIAEDELVTVMVELKDAPLLEENPFALTEDGEVTISARSEYNEILRNQEAVLKDVEELFTEDEFALLYTYSYVLNGFSAKVPANSLNAISKINGVASVYTDIAYQVVPTMDSASEMVNVANGEGISQYTGKGTVISIIDTGLDLDHEAFQTLPDDSEKVLNVEAVSGILNSGSLKASTRAAEAGVTLSSEAAVNYALVNNTWDVYVNDKVPYAFNYAAKTAAYYVPDHAKDAQTDHGTHVAGIAAGYKESEEGAVTFTGIAPNAQLLIMKVFGSERSGQWSDILAALEDSLTLGADVINMSLGSSAGFSYVGSYPGTEEVINRIMDAGIILACAAGNEYTAAYGNLYGNDLALASNPDNGIVSSPSTFVGSYAVASVDNNYIFSKGINVNGRTIVYTNYFTAESRDINKLNTATQEYAVLLDGDNNVLTGTQAEFDTYCSTHDITGKIIVIKRGQTFTETVAFAEAKGAVGLIVFDHSAGALSTMAENTNVNIPAIFISKADGEYMVSNYLAGNTSLIVETTPSKALNPSGNKMSEFSSWGVTPDLKLKPEITAPGGKIYSTTDGNTYGTKSGTSMATPVVAGLSALMVEYTGSKLDAAGSWTGFERQKIIKAILTSTAEPVMFDETTPYSPRKQGAGLVNFQNALNTGAYLTVDGSPTPKADLGDDKDKMGLYQIEFDIVNFSENSQTYKISADVLTERVEIQDVTHTLNIKNYDTDTVTKNLTGVKFMSGEPYLLNNHATVFSNYRNDEVTVESGKTASVTIVISIDENGRDYLDSNFENGIYVDGFIKLTNEDTNGVNLTLPFLAFYGDWTEAPLLDEGNWMEVYSGEDVLPQMAYSTGLKITTSSTFGDTDSILGTTRSYDTPSWFASTGHSYLPERNTITSTSSSAEASGINGLVSVKTALLRNAKNICYQVYHLKEGTTTDQINDYKNYQSIVDFDKKIVEDNKAFARKTNYDLNNDQMIITGHYAEDRFYWDGKDQNGADLPNGTTIMIVVTAQMDNPEGNGTNESCQYMFPVKIDHYLPDITDVSVTMENGDLTLDYNITDNMYISNVKYVIWGSFNGNLGITLSEAGLIPGDHILSDSEGETQKITKVFEDIFTNPKYPKIDRIEYISIEVCDFASESTLNNATIIRPIYDININNPAVYITEGSSIDFDISGSFGGQYANNSAFQPTITLTNDTFEVISSNPDLINYNPETKKLVSTASDLTELTSVTITVRGYFNYLETHSLTIKVVPSAMQNAVDAAIAGSGTLDWTFGDKTTSIDIDGNLVLDFGGATLESLEGKAAITINSGDVTIKNVTINQNVAQNVAKADALKHMLAGGIPGISIIGGNVTLENAIVNGEVVSFASGKYSVSSAIDLANGATLTLKASELHGVYGVNNKLENATAGGMITIVDAAIEGSVSAIKNYVNGTNVTISSGSTAYDTTKSYEDAMTGLVSDSMLNGTSASYYRKGDLCFDFSNATELAKWTITGGIMEIVNLGTTEAPDNYLKITTDTTDCYMTRTFSADEIYTTITALDVWHIYYRSAGTNLPFQLFLTYADNPTELQIFQQWCSTSQSLTHLQKVMTSYATGYLDGKVVTSAKIKIAPGKAVGSVMHLKAFTKTQSFKTDPYGQNDSEINTSPTNLLVVKNAVIAMSNPSYTVSQEVGTYSVTVTPDDSNMNKGFNQQFGLRWIPTAATLVKGAARYLCDTPSAINGTYTFTFNNLPADLGECEIVFDYMLYSSITDVIYANAITEGYTSTKAMYDAEMLDEFIEESLLNALQITEIESTINQIFTNFAALEEGFKNRDAKNWDSPMGESKFKSTYPELVGTLIGHPDDGGIYRNSTNSVGPYWGTPYGEKLGYYQGSVKAQITTAEGFKDAVMNSNTGTLTTYKNFINEFLNIYLEGVANCSMGEDILSAQLEWLNTNYQELINKLSAMISSIKFDTAATASYSSSKFSLWDHLTYSIKPNAYVVMYAIEPFDNTLYAELLSSLGNMASEAMDYRNNIVKIGYSSQALVNIAHLTSDINENTLYIDALLQNKHTKYPSLFVDLYDKYFMKTVFVSFTKSVNLVVEP